MPPPTGQRRPGNINFFEQPEVRNPDGSWSTVDTIGITEDGNDYVLPRVTPDGRHLTTDEAIAEFHKTGRHAGVFRPGTPEEYAAKTDPGSVYARQLHKDYELGNFREPLRALRKATSIGANPNAIPRTRPTAPDTAPRMYAPSWRERLTGYAQDAWDSVKEHPLVQVADLLGLTNKREIDRSFVDPNYEPPIGEAVSPYGNVGQRTAATAAFKAAAEGMGDAGKRQALLQFAERYPRVAALMKLHVEGGAAKASQFAAGRNMEAGTMSRGIARVQPPADEKDRILNYLARKNLPLASDTEDPALQRAYEAIATVRRRPYERTLPKYAGTSQPGEAVAELRMTDRPTGTLEGEAIDPAETVGHEARHVIDVNRDPLLFLRANAEKTAGRPYLEMSAEKPAWPAGIDYATRTRARAANAAAGQPALGAAPGQWMSPFSNRLSTMNAQDTASMAALRERVRANSSIDPFENLASSVASIGQPDPWQPKLPGTATASGSPISDTVNRLLERIYAPLRVR